MDLAQSILTAIASIFENLQIRYVLVGSFASSIHGMYRTTADIDVLAELTEEHVQPLFEAVKENFYVDEAALRDAVSKRRSFNMIHFDSVFKIDVFVAKDRFAVEQLNRRQLRPLPESQTEIYVATAEDTILAKLSWFRAGHEVSRSQWSDVAGILATQRNTLDFEYLNKWANSIGVSDLLEKILEESN